MLHRFRARMRFSEGHWGPTWCRDQMAVRYGQAVHIRQGEPAEEAPINQIEGDVFICDVALMDAAAAQDAVNTLSDHNVLGVTLALDQNLELPSYVEYHLCDHAEDDRSGCSVVDRREVG
jgi:hypothetical protein